MNLRHATTAKDFLSVNHPHIGKTKGINSLTVLLGIFAATNRKIDSIEAGISGKLETVALHTDINRFMLTIGRSFVLLTFQDGSERMPIIQKKWKRTNREIGKGITANFGTEDTYVDSDGLTWVHSHKRTHESDELVGFDSQGNEALRMTLEVLN